MKSKGKFIPKRNLEKASISLNSKTKIRQGRTNVTQKSNNNPNSNLKTSKEVKKEIKKESKSRSNSKKSRNSSQSKSPPSKTQKSIKRIINIIPSQPPAPTNNLPIYFENIKKYENFMSDSVIHNNFGSLPSKFNDLSLSVQYNPKSLIHYTNEDYHNSHYSPYYIKEGLNLSNNLNSDIVSIVRLPDKGLNPHYSNSHHRSIILPLKLETIDDNESKEFNIPNDENWNSLNRTVKIGHKEYNNLEDTLHYLNKLSKKEIGLPTIFNKPKYYLYNQEKPDYLINEDDSIQHSPLHNFERSLKHNSESFNEDSNSIRVHRNRPINQFLRYHSKINDQNRNFSFNSHEIQNNLNKNLQSNSYYNKRHLDFNLNRNEISENHIHYNQYRPNYIRGDKNLLNSNYLTRKRLRPIRYSLDYKKTYE